MNDPELIEVYPGDLRLPRGRRDGADPWNLQLQIAKHGTSVVGMPRILVTRDGQDNLIINDGVTRATRVAKLLPDATLVVEVIDHLPIDLSKLSTVREKLP